MRGRTRLITTSALLTSLTMVFLYLSSVFPTMQLTFIAAASLFVVVQVIENGIKGGLFVFIGSTLLGFLIVPDKTSMILYALFFGYYPIVKSLAERPRNAVLRWVIKLLVMNAALAVILRFFGELIFDLSQFEYGVWVFAAMFNVAFILFDIAITMIAALYIRRFRKK
jgi:hypothetical protein